MALFLTVHTRYKDVQIGIFNNLDLIDLISEENKKISKNFLYLMGDLLKKNNLSLENFDFIAANQGPAPFTTLRVSLSSINGLAFATKIPLVGINSLEVILQDYKEEKYITVALLNAFCQEIYYAYYNPKTSESYLGYAPANSFLNDLEKSYTDKFKFIGNGTELYLEDIKKIFGSRAIIPDIIPNVASIESISKYALEKYILSNKEKQLMPIYLKTASPKIELSKNL